MSSLIGLMVRLWLMGSALWATLSAALFWDDFLCALGMGGNLDCGAGPPVPLRAGILELIVGVPLVTLVLGLLSIWALKHHAGRGRGTG